MKVNFYATYRPIVGGKTIDFDVDHGITIHQLVEAIIARFPAMRREMLDDARSTFIRTSTSLSMDAMRVIWTTGWTP